MKCVTAVVVALAVVVASTRAQQENPQSTSAESSEAISLESSIDTQFDLEEDPSSLKNTPTTPLSVLSIEEIPKSDSPQQQQQQPDQPKEEDNESTISLTESTESPVPIAASDEILALDFDASETVTMKSHSFDVADNDTSLGSRPIDTFMADLVPTVVNSSEFVVDSILGGIGLASIGNESAIGMDHANNNNNNNNNDTDVKRENVASNDDVTVEHKSIENDDDVAVKHESTENNHEFKEKNVESNDDAAVKHDSMESNDDAAVKHENVEDNDDDVVKQENVEKNDDADVDVKTENTENEEKSGENIDQSMLSVEMENIDNVKMIDTDDDRNEESDKMSSTTELNAENHSTDETVVTKNFKPTTTTSTSTSSTTIAAENSEENVSMNLKVSTPSSEVTSEMRVDNTSTMESVATEVPEKSMENISDVSSTKMTDSELQGTTEPLSNHLTNDRNVVTELTNGSGIVNSLPVRDYNYLVHKDSNVSCILASMTVLLKVPYKTTDNKKITKLIEMPSTAGVSGNCGERLSDLTFKWTEDSQYNEENILTLRIARDENSFYVQNVHVNVFLGDESFPDATETMTAENSEPDLRLFSASIKDGVHVCNSVTEIQCGKIVVMIKALALVAYNDKQDVSYRKEELCVAKINLRTTTIIGSAVGVVIIIAIVIILAWMKKRSNAFRSELP